MMKPAALMWVASRNHHSKIRWKGVYDKHNVRHLNVAPQERAEEIMNDQGFTTTFTVDQSPEEAFAAINNVRGWWSGNIDGSTDKLGDEFTYRYEDFHRSKQRITELVPGKKVVWHVLDGYLKFTQDTTEWTGTDVIFDISRKGDKTEVRFTHQGLVPEFECFDVCSNAWGSYISGSLRSLITKGEGRPNPKEEVGARLRP